MEAAQRGAGGKLGCPTDPTDPRGLPYVGRRAKRVSTEALAELESLVTAGLDAKAILADVNLDR
jgi:hypothetical protein